MSSPPDSVPAVVAASLETWTRQLLDLTRRNRALNFRPLTVSTVQVVGPPPAAVHHLVCEEERALTFAPAPEQSALPNDGVLQTTLTAEQLDHSLRRIEEQARLSIEEQGVNTLFLALGLLHYTEAEASDVVFRAPLVLLPVSLRRTSARAAFTLDAADDEPMVNPALAEMLSREYGLALPDLPEAAPLPPADAGSAAPHTLQSLFVDVQALVDALPVAKTGTPWKVTSEVFLGLFSFQKLVMYKDLEANAAAIRDHRLVHQLITRRGAVKGGGLGLPDDVRQARLDEVYPPELGAHVVDADGSQQRALAAVDRGYDLVVEGPPGTGKSQTITNVIAQALHAGKSVLFVAEKMAALDVVHQRLQQAGLGEFCLELHSTRSSKREVIRSIASALDASLLPSPVPADAGERLREVRASLSAYVTALHEPFAAMQASPFTAYGELARVLDAPHVDWTGDATQVTRLALEQAQSHLQALASAAEAAGDIATHPWRDTGRTFYPQDQLDAVVAAATAVAHRIPEVRAAAIEATRLLGLPLLAALTDLERVRDVVDLLRRSPGAPIEQLESPEWNAVPHAATELIGRVREVQRLEAETGRRFHADALQVDHTADIAYIEDRSGVLASLFWWLDSRQRAIRTRWTAMRQPGYAASIAAQAHDLKAVVALRTARQTLDDLQAQGARLFGAAWRGAASDVDALDRQAAWVVAFRKVHLRETLPSLALTLAAAGQADLGPADRLDQRASELLTCVDRLATLLQWRADRPSLASLPLEQVHERAAGFVTDATRAARWGAFAAARQDALDTLAASAVDLADTGRLRFADLPRAVPRAFWFAWLAACVDARPALARFQALSHEQRVREFRDLDRRVLEDNRARLVASLRARVQTRLHEDDVDAAMPVLRREMAKQRNHRPIRETLGLAAAAVRAIKPVFLMSPLSVAQFTKGDRPTFDLVVFDEASQLPPEDAVGAIVRGAQLVVVGDPKQLPPTNFFTAARDDLAAADSDDGVDVPDAESILEAFMGCGVPMSRLKWHYRSAHESLISFSNVSFYDGDLLTFPSVEPMSERLGLRFELVADAVYEGKGLNLIEARRVADAVVAFAREQVVAEQAGARALTLGVGTFNLRQQVAIQDLLEERRREDPSLEPFFDRSRHEPFFVKNLENIQGDERDVIFLSVTYAKGRDGRLRQHFGPLNGDNGWRRLNVLTTRARRAMRVFSSMRASDIHEGQSKGGPLLKAFLEYAESGRLDHPVVAASAATESPFEQEVVTDLARRGHLVQPQVGVAGYRIDIGVRDPGAPGRFLLGIECDGVAYHASDTARDRDRLRQQVLEARGWTIVRLWSTDWFKDRVGQMERLERAIDDARRRGPVGVGAGVPVADRRTRPVATDAAATTAAAEASGVAAGLVRQTDRPDEATDQAVASRSAVPYVKASAPASVTGSGVLECDLSVLASIAVHVVGIESPVHEDDVVARVAGFWDQRVGTRIRAHVLAACSEAVRRGAVERREAFLWVPGSACQPRDRSDTGIGADRIAPEEYDAAVRAALAGGRILRRDALLVEARTHLGFERTGSTLGAALESSLQRLVASGTIGEGSDGYRLRR